jgi:putative FmdB family regulatory protein
MPTYAYRCVICSHEFQRFEKMSAPTRTKCPECGERAERLITGGAGLHFKGSGFYITDYKKSGEAGKAAEPAKAGDAAKTGDKKPETKKADTKPKKGTDS